MGTVLSELQRLGSGDRGQNKLHCIIKTFLLSQVSLRTQERKWMHAEWESSLPKAWLPGLDPPLVGPGSTWEWGTCDSEVGFPEGWPEACIKLPRPELVRGPFPRMAGRGEREGWMILRQRQSCTFVGGHEVLSLVFAVVEATGEDQVIVVTLEEESVRRATGQEGAPFGESTDTLLPLGFWGASHPRVPPTHVLVLRGGVQE